MSGGSTSKQESSNRTVTTTNTSTVQGIEEGGMVAGGNITTIDAGTVDLARLAIESSLAGLIEGQGQAIDAIEDNSRGAITAMSRGQESAFDFGRYALQSVETSQSEALAFANETIAESLASYGNTALSMSKASSSDTTQILNNALKYGGIGIAGLAVVFAISGVMKR
jgi:hypothetical protein